MIDNTPMLTPEQIKALNKRLVDNCAIALTKDRGDAAGYKNKRLAKKALRGVR
jgi:hypothetical protein